MRRVAAELGAGTMTLYNYVRTKDDLVSLMHDAIMAEVYVPPDELPREWRPALAMIARRTRSVLLRHPWSLASLQTAQPGPNAMRRFEQYFAALASTELDTAAKFDQLTMVTSYVFGNAMITSESLTRAATAEAEPDATAAMMEFGMAQLRSGQFPHTAALFAQMSQPSPDGAADGPGKSAGPPMDEKGLAEQFERGLEALLDGAALRTNLPGALPTGTATR